jgi:hypothetical protein
MILWYVKNPLRYDTDTDRQNSADISYPVFPDLPLGAYLATRTENFGG